MLHFYCLFLTLLIIASEGTIVVTTGTRGEDVTLQCDVSHGWMDQKKCYRGRWIKYSNNIQQVMPHNCDKCVPGENLPLKLSQLNESHEGLYSCEIWEGWERVHTQNISLKVKECKVEVVANVSFGSSFELKCPGNVTVSRDISWFWLNAGTPGRVPPERAKEDGLSLHFHTLDDSARGWYRCKYNIGETQRCFEFNLQNKAIATTESTMKPSVHVDTEGGNTAVVVPLLTVTAAVAVLTALLVIRRYVYKRFAAQPENPQPGLSSALIPPFSTHLLWTDLHPHFPASADTLSHSPHEYESVDLQPTEFSDFEDGNGQYSLCQQESGFDDTPDGDIFFDRFQEENG